MRLAVAGAVLALLPLAGGCAGDPQDDYCAAIEEHQAALTEIASGGGQDGLIRALDILRDLREKAPADIGDEWQQVVTRIETLESALEDAGVDAATYDRKNTPAGLSADERARIDAAARELGSAATLQAFEALDQQARDVCKTPMTL